ncbi:MAG TPA: prenyltransferase [Anaerolineae bacterium]|nr:prenyltransferase [Anaerolineae bacterium]
MTAATRGQQLSALVRMARPTTLPGGILAYVVGAAMGYGHAGSFDWGLAAVGLVVTEVTNLVASYADEYADVDTDTLARRTRFSGGSGVLPAGIVPAAWALRAAALSAGASVLLTTALIAAGVLSPHVAWIVGLGLVGGWFYAMPPVQMERRGLGEIDNALIGGILMPLMGYTVQVGRPSLDAFLALLPVFLLVLANLLGVHWPDREADAAVGKRSLVVIAGEKVRPLHHALVATSYLLALALTGPVLPVAVTAGLVCALPLNVWSTVTLARQRSTVPSAVAMAGSLALAAAGWVVVATGPTL